jgi:hypothetical protein
MKLISMKPLLSFVVAVAFSSTSTALAASIPNSTGTTLDGQSIVLPRDLAPQATVLILGFTQHSQDATTAWEKAVRASISSPGITYFDIPFIEDAPRFVRPMIVHAIRKQVPDIVKPRFLPLAANEAAWKQAADFSASAPDAAYVLLVDRSGNIRWQTHEPCSPTLLAQLSQKARAI